MVGAEGGSHALNHHQRDSDPGCPDQRRYGTTEHAYRLAGQLIEKIPNRAFPVRCSVKDDCSVSSQDDLKEAAYKQERHLRSHFVHTAKQKGPVKKGLVVSA